MLRNRRKLSGAIALLILYSMIIQAQTAPPNLVLRVADDHGYEKTGSNEQQHVKTPNLLDQRTRQAEELQPKLRFCQDTVLTSLADAKIGRLRANKVLILGNSITLHGPAPKIGWNGNWGMAASAQNKDFVHLLSNQLAKASGGTPSIKVKNIAEFERTLTAYNVQQELKAELEFKADIIVLAIGENAATPKTDEEKVQFTTAFQRLLSELKSHGEPNLFVRSQFWQDAVKDQLMKKCCEEAAGTLIDISQLGLEEANYARSERKFEHAGVAGHPGDKGMQALADAIWNAIETQSQTR